MEPIPTDLADRSKRLLKAAAELGETRLASQLRAWCVPYLFNGMERAFDSNQPPSPEINMLLDRLASFLESATATDINLLGAARAHENLSQSRDLIEKTTGEHYGRLFREFSKSSFWEEPAALLRARLERNGINLSKLPEMNALDAGCGGGRYTVAWRLLGAKEVTGVDISSIGIANARQRIAQSGQSVFEGVKFEEGSVLDLPFPDDRFDIVFSNGVLHHTVDWRKGIFELVRVLKPGGFGWLYLIENPGGLFWSVIEVLRGLMGNEDREFARLSLQTLGMPDNRIFYMLDHVMAPVNLRLTPAEIESALNDAGATGIRRLTRGADFDRIEQIHQRRPFAEEKYGVGENRYVFSK